jgi:hypothetical protein
LSTKDAEQILEAIEQAEVSLMVHDENGLFRKLASQNITYEANLELLLKARKALSPSPPPKIPDTLLARKLTDLAQHRLSTAFDEVGWSYRWLYVNPVFTLAYLLAAFAVVVVIDLRSLPVVLFGIVPIWAFLAGALGAILRTLWSLWNSASTRRYRKAWTVWFMGAPVMGGIFGALIYTALLGGLVAVSPSQPSMENIALPWFLTGLAGFSSEWAKDFLTKIQKAISG